MCVCVAVRDWGRVGWGGLLRLCVYTLYAAMHERTKINQYSIEYVLNTEHLPFSLSTRKNGAEWLSAESPSQSLLSPL